MAPACGQGPFGYQPAAGKMGGDLACVRGLPADWVGGAPTGPLVHRREAATFLPNTPHPQFVSTTPALRHVHALHPSHSG